MKVMNVFENSYFVVVKYNNVKVLYTFSMHQIEQ